MPPRRGSAAHPGPPRHIDLDSDSEEEEEEDDDECFILRCLSCGEEYDPEDAGTCKACYVGASETEQELKRQIEELKSKVTFLKLMSPVDSVLRFNPYAQCSTYVILVPYCDSSAGPAASVHAHKAILADRSPVFKAMLENDMEESRSGTIKIADVSYDALRAFVNYLYTAEATLDDHMACSLLVMAEKYQVKHLKTYCEQYLITELNCDKAVTNYAFAHQQNAKQLQEAALTMITENMESFTKSEGYAELKDSNPRIIVEIFEAYLAKQDDPSLLLEG